MLKQSACQIAKKVGAAADNCYETLKQIIWKSQPLCTAMDQVCGCVGQGRQWDGARQTYTYAGE